MYPAAMNAAVAAAAASRHPGPQPGQPFKFTVAESCDRMKEEFNFLQAQYHNIKMEADKLVQEKSEMQRHYVMYYEMSYGLNVEMHKQTEIGKRLNAILAQIMPFLSQEHQQQVAAAIERAKQVTMTELNAIIGMQAQQAALPHAAAHPPLPLGPHPALPGLPTLPPSSAAMSLPDTLSSVTPATPSGVTTATPSGVTPATPSGVTTARSECEGVGAGVTLLLHSGVQPEEPQVLTPVESAILEESIAQYLQDYN